MSAPFVAGSVIQAISYSATDLDWVLRVTAPGAPDLSADTVCFRLMNEITMGKPMRPKFREGMRGQLQGRTVRAVEFVLAPEGPGSDYWALTFDCGEICIRITT